MRDATRSLLLLFAVGGAATFAGCTVTSESPNLTGQDVRLTIIHTADIHSRLFPYQFAPGGIDKGLGLVPTHGDIAIVGGIARIATVVRCIRGDMVACQLHRGAATIADLVGGPANRTLHLDSGDMFEGAPVFNTFAGEVEMRSMTRLGLNAMALGNHEFDKGAVNLELMKSNFGGFPILAANYQFADPKDPTQPKLKLVIAPFTIFNVQGLRVGVIGMGNLSSLQGVIEGGNSLGIVPLEATRAVADTVNILRGSVDVVILISHLGLDEDEGVAQTTNVADQNPIIDGVDVTLGGHLHIVLNPPKDIPRFDESGNPTGHTILCHSGAFAKYVGRLDLAVHIAETDPAKRPGLGQSCGPDAGLITLPDDGGVIATPNNGCPSGLFCDFGTHQCTDRNAVKSYVYKLIPIDDSIPEDAEMANMLEPYQLKMNTALNLTHNYAIVPCAATDATCPKVTRSDSSGGDSQLGNLVAASMRLRKRVEADFGLTNSLGIRADFESGPLNLEEMYNVFPFDNTITTMFLSGNEIQQMFDFIASRSAERGCKTQSQVSGVWFVGDCTNKVACGPFDASGKLVTSECKSREVCGTDAANKVCKINSDCVSNICDPIGLTCTPGANGCHRVTRPEDGPFLIGDNCLDEKDGACAGDADCAQYGQYFCASNMKCRKQCTPVLPAGEYRVAVNDYIASGGSGFAVLKRNTTKFNTGISLRDALIDYITDQSQRCDVATYVNLQTVSCQPPGGARGDCTAMCCNDPMNTTGGCNASSMVYKGCDSMSFQPLLIDNSTLPCLDRSVQKHDGRIQMIGGH